MGPDTTPTDPRVCEGSRWTESLGRGRTWRRRGVGRKGGINSKFQGDFVGTQRVLLKRPVQFCQGGVGVL